MSPLNRVRMQSNQQEAQWQMLSNLLYDFLRRTAQTHRGNLEATYDQLRLINGLARQIAFAQRVTK